MLPAEALVCLSACLRRRQQRTTHPCFDCTWDGAKQGPLICSPDIDHQRVHVWQEADRHDA